MNRAKNLVNAPNRQLAVTYSKAGAKVNQTTNLNEVVNVTLNGMMNMAIATAGTDSAKRTELSELFSTAFANFLAAFSPVDYFPDKADLQAEIDAENKKMEAQIAMGNVTDIDFAKLKDKQKEKISEARQWQEEHPEELINV